MNKTFSYKIKTSDNPDLFDQILSDCTGLFYELYNNLELSQDKVFINYCLKKFDLDKTIYDYCLVDVKAQRASLEEIREDKKVKIEKINEELSQLSKKKKLTNKQKYHKKHLLKTKAYLLRNINKDICFGGKALLRQITKIQQKVNKTNGDKRRLKRDKAQFKEERKRGIFLWGKAIEGGNRKIDFFFKDNYLLLKISKKKQIKISLIPFSDKKRREEIVKISQMIKENLISITARITKTHVNLTFDNEILNGYSFDIQKYNSTLKEHPELDYTDGRNNLRKELYEEQKQRKLKNKIENRVAGVDLNPHEIGFSISDINKNDGETDKIIFYKSFDLSFYTKQTCLSSKNRLKFKYEISKIYSFIFKSCVHFKVGYFGFEDLTKITESLKDNGKEFNRITKNIWNREQQTELITSNSDELGIIHEEVSPSYSSFIGNVKYELYDPISASLEIGRRAYVKYKKITGKHFYPCLNKESIEKMSYLSGKDLSNKKTWVALYKRLNQNDITDSGGWWRNKIFTVGGYLDSKKSNVHICF